MSTQTIELAHATGGVSDTHLKNSAPIGFDTFCTRLAETTPKPGTKDGAYFVRGPVNGNATRSDANIIRADVVILDGDSSTTDNGTTEKGAPCPSLVHEALKGADIAHAIYTSYSHTPESPRYRVIVPCRMESKQELTAVVEWLIDLLHRESVPLAGVPENLAWAQAWYYPRLAGTDSQYLTYSHDTDERLNLVAIMDWHAERHEPPPARPTSAVQGDTPWNQYNAKHGTPEAMGALLEARGYIAKGTGEINGTEAYRFLHPSSQTGSPGVRLFKGRHGKWLVSSSHGGDVLNDGHAHDAFSLFTVLNQGGDTKAAVEAYLGTGADPETAQAPSVVRDPVAWMDSFKISRKTMDNIANPEWIYENLVIQGHVVAIVAAPNGGKTTIMLQVAADMAAHGYRVIYVNADTSGGDAKSMKDFADESGFEMLLPDLVAGKSMKDVVENLKAMSTVDADMSKLVFIFDTLKKMTNVINKSQAADLYKTFRSLTGKGVTSILLAHTNKYKDSEGKPVYEGTGDLRADADELIYLTGDKKADGTMTVSTDPDKVRGAFKPISFNIDVERNVTRCGYVDVGEEVRRKRQYETDRDAIEVITETLGGATVGKTELLNDVRKNGIGRNRARRVLERYCGNDAYVQCWVKEIGFANNVIKFRKIKTVLVSSDHTSVGGENEQ